MSAIAEQPNRILPQQASLTSVPCLCSLETRNLQPLSRNHPLHDGLAYGNPCQLGMLKFNQGNGVQGGFYDESELGTDGF